MIKEYIEKIVREMLEDKFVYCDECGVVVSKDKAHKVRVENPFPMKVDGYLLYYYCDRHDDIKFYCDRHKKNYDKIENNVKEKGGYIIKYYKSNVEVGKNGKIITQRKP